MTQSLPRRLPRSLAEHDVRTVAEAEWSGADRNLQYQQNLAALPVAVVVLVAHDNRLETLLPLVPKLLTCLATLVPNTLTRVGD